MHHRHTKPELYFNEQSVSTERYIVPYIGSVLDLSLPITVAEVGCSYGGNLKPFLQRGCKITGIDINSNSIKTAELFYENDPNRENLLLIARDIYDITPDELPAYDLIIMRDTLEHIHHQEHFLEHIKSFLKPSGKLFIAFPPWRMPFGGHQQMCDNRFLSHLPYFHLLPKRLYRWILKCFSEDENKIGSLLEIKETRLSIQRFHKIVNKQDFAIEKETLYIINPNYEVKFGMKPRTLPLWMNIPVIRDFFTTACYGVLSLHKEY